LNSAQAINIFYKQVELAGGLPFNVVVPNETTRQTFQKTDEGKDLVVCEDADDMFKKLGL
jgi:DNA-damage-inducible protein J